MLPNISKMDPLDELIQLTRTAEYGAICLVLEDGIFIKTISQMTRVLSSAL